MSKFIIEGKRKLIGEVTVSGAKNNALKIMAACILTKGDNILENVPEISDIDKMSEIIRGLGGRVEKIKPNTLLINTDKINSFEPNPELVGAFRASIVLIGPLLARFGQVIIPFPGGDLIGGRSISSHLEAFKLMGVKISRHKNVYNLKTNKLISGKIVLEEFSWTATENIMMAASLTSGKTQIRLAAAEPEIAALAKFLNQAGAKIIGAGTNYIDIQGVSSLKATNFRIIPERIEAETLAIAALVTNGNITIKNITIDYLDSFLNVLKKINANFEISNNQLTIKPSPNLKSVNLQTRPYPGFPTDLQAQMTVLLTQAKGTSEIFETLFENRFKHVPELVKMGAKINILNPHAIQISGPTKLHGTEITSTDIRAGAALILAALAAEGNSIVNDIEHIDRGYENLEGKLNSLGASIKRGK